MNVVASVIAIAILLSSGQLPPKAGTVVSKTEPKVDFSKFTTYTWARGQDTFDKKAHAAVVAAVDAEMAKRGFKQASSGAGDVTIRYFSVVRTDVDLDKIEEAQRQNKPAPTQSLGRLVVVMRDASDRRVWAADTVQPLSADRETVYGEIPSVVAKLFEKYPGTKK